LAFHRLAFFARILQILVEGAQDLRPIQALIFDLNRLDFLLRRRVKSLVHDSLGYLLGAAQFQRVFQLTFVCLPYL